MDQRIVPFVDGDEQEPHSIAHAHAQNHVGHSRAWWSSISADDPQWPSLHLAFSATSVSVQRPSAAIAGITIWFSLSSFREFVESIPPIQPGSYRIGRRRPLIRRSQAICSELQRAPVGSRVDVSDILDELCAHREMWMDVPSFWDVYRRGLELELDGDQISLARLSTILGTGPERFETPRLSVSDCDDFRSGLARYLQHANGVESLPYLLPIILDRQYFDARKHRWDWHNRPIHPVDCLDLSHWCAQTSAIYTLYGAIVHQGGWNHGVSFAVLRPNGIGGQWYAFEGGNEIEEYDNLYAQVEGFGCQSSLDAYDDVGEQRVVHIVVFIRNDGGEFESRHEGSPYYHAPGGLKNDPRLDSKLLLRTARKAYGGTHVPSQTDMDQDKRLLRWCCDDFVVDCNDTLDVHDFLKEAEMSNAWRVLTMNSCATYGDVRAHVAHCLAIEDGSTVHLFSVEYSVLDRWSRAELVPVDDEQPVCLNIDDRRDLRVWSFVWPAGATRRTDDFDTAVCDNPTLIEANHQVHVDADEALSMVSPPATHVYGFLHRFDAQTQRFVALRPTLAATTRLVRSVVVDVLGYDDETVRIWERPNPFDLVPVNRDATFDDLDLAHGFTLVLEPLMSEAIKDQIQRSGMFTRPVDLMQYLIYRARMHPVLSLTSTAPREVRSCTNDYLQGPFVNGRLHGPRCTIISRAGHSYQGPCVGGRKHGEHGTMVYANGDTYAGGWLDDMCSGSGEYTEARTGNRFVGHFVRGTRTSGGVTYWKTAQSDARTCSLCIKADTDALLFPCGHVCTCLSCGKHCRQCPVCEQDVLDCIRIHHA